MGILNEGNGGFYMPVAPAGYGGNNGGTTPTPDDGGGFGG